MGMLTTLAPPSRLPRLLSCSLLPLLPLLLLLLLLPLLLLPTHASASARRGSSRPDQYLVLLAPSTDLAAHLRAVLPPSASAASSSSSSSAASSARVAPTLVHAYTRALHGYALRCTDSFAATLRARDDVRHVEQDRYVHLDDVYSIHLEEEEEGRGATTRREQRRRRRQRAGAAGAAAAAAYGARRDADEQRAGEQLLPPSWGLDRVDQRALPLDGVYRYPDHGGAGVDIYIVDTGIELTHPVRG